MGTKKTNTDTLEGVMTEAFAMLKRGADRYNDPFHWPVLGSSGNNRCNLRTVILRRFNMPERLLVCYTDARAPKSKEIQNHNQVMWLFYHPRKKVQLRLSGTATLHTDDAFADEQWSAANLTNRINYCATASPGTPCDKPSSGLPDFLIHKVPTLLESETGRRNFMAISCRIDSMDWLKLSILGNRRARFDWNQNGLSATWVIP